MESNDNCMINGEVDNHLKFLISEYEKEDDSELKVQRKLHVNMYRLFRQAKEANDEYSMIHYSVKLEWVKRDIEKRKSLIKEMKAKQVYPRTLEDEYENILSIFDDMHTQFPCPDYYRLVLKLEIARKLMGMYDSPEKQEFNPKIIFGGFPRDLVAFAHQMKKFKKDYPNEDFWNPEIGDFKTRTTLPKDIDVFYPLQECDKFDITKFPITNPLISAEFPLESLGRPIETEQTTLYYGYRVQHRESVSTFNFNYPFWGIEISRIRAVMIGWKRYSHEEIYCDIDCITNNNFFRKFAPDMEANMLGIKNGKLYVFHRPDYSHLHNQISKEVQEESRLAWEEKEGKKTKQEKKEEMKLIDAYWAKVDAETEEIKKKLTEEDDIKRKLLFKEYEEEKEAAKKIQDDIRKDILFKKYEEEKEAVKNSLRDGVGRDLSFGEYEEKDKAKKDIQDDFTKDLLFKKYKEEETKNIQDDIEREIKDPLFLKYKEKYEAMEKVLQDNIERERDLLFLKYKEEKEAMMKPLYDQKEEDEKKEKQIVKERCRHCKLSLGFIISEIIQKQTYVIPYRHTFEANKLEENQVKGRKLRIRRLVRMLKKGWKLINLKDLELEKDEDEFDEDYEAPLKSEIVLKFTHCGTTMWEEYFYEFCDRQLETTYHVKCLDGHLTDII